MAGKKRKLQFKKELSCILLEVLFMVTLAGLFLGRGSAIIVDYQVFEDERNYQEAQSACKQHGFAHLANIKNRDNLEAAQNLSKFNSSRKYWMGLSVNRSKWYWSTSEEIKTIRPDFSELLDQNKAQNFSGTRAFCYMVTNRSKLEMHECEAKHYYICGGLPTSQMLTRSTASGVESTATFSITVTPTVKLSPHYTERIVPTKAYSTPSLVSSVLPKTLVSQERQIQEYITKIKQLPIFDGNSLQDKGKNADEMKKRSVFETAEKEDVTIAANETSVLLSKFHGISDHKINANVLPGLEQLENFIEKYASTHLDTKSIVNSTRIINGKYFVIMVEKIGAGHKSDVTYPFEDNMKVKIIIPAELFKTRETVLVGITYKDIPGLLPGESHSFLDGERLENAKLWSSVMACSVFPKPPDVLPGNVTILFTDENTKAEDTPNCVFWDFDIKSTFNGSWSSRGCSLVNRSESQVICTCNHLTHFAVLMQIGDDTNLKTSAKHQTALEVITYVGCGLSLFGEVLTVIAYLTLLNFKQEQCQIRLNLVISIAIAQILFLAGIDANSLQKVCIFVAASIHYFYLAGFAWMLMEGIYLYLMVVKVFNTLVKMRVFYAFSWGFPCVVVLLSLVLAHITNEGITSYVHSDFCWVSFSNSLVWTFVAPVLLVCLVNSVILCRVVCEMTKMQSVKDVSNMRQGLRACVVLLPLLGLTWVFGILSVTDAGLAFQYIFTIFNSLQGFFIFVIHVLRSSEFRAAYLRKKQKWQTRNSSFPNSRSAGDASSVFSEGHGMSTVQGTTGSPDPLFRRHQVSPMSSDITKTRESCLTPVAID